MDYPIEKYRFIQAGDKVIAISTFAGKTVRGMAKCDPRDDFDIETGKEIAATRCAYKVAKRRVARAKKKNAEAIARFKQAANYRDKMRQYELDSLRAVADLKIKLDGLCS